MSFLNPTIAEARRTRLIVGGLSLLMTVIVMIGFALESRTGLQKIDPVLIYFQNWRADRSDAEVKADREKTMAAREAKMAESRAYIATLRGEARVKAQGQYDAYVAGNGGRKDIPYVAARPVGLATAAEPPVE